VHNRDRDTDRLGELQDDPDFEMIRISLLPLGRDIVPVDSVHAAFVASRNPVIASES
jgi:hypothetical protein